jgi:hypothetical protein
MLLSLVLHHPEALATIVARTPTWVWGLLAGLVVLGATQLRDRTASLVRMSITPVAMTAFSAWGMVTAFGSSPLFGQVLAVWVGVAIAVAAALAPGRTAATYDPARRAYRHARQRRAAAPPRRHLPGEVERRRRAGDAAGGRA